MGKRKNPIVKMYHVRYVSDLLVPATNTREAFARADEEMINMVEGDEKELDEIFTITIESNAFHIIPEDNDDEDDDDEDPDDPDVEDDDEDDEDDEDEDEDEDDDDSDDDEDDDDAD